MPDFGSMRILPTVSLTGQTASIGATNLLASATAGLYRVVWYLRASSAGAAGTCLLTLAWNDGSAQSFTSSTIALSVLGSALSGTTVLRSAAAQAITYETTVAGAVGDPQYQLDIRIEPM